MGRARLFHSCFYIQSSNSTTGRVICTEIRLCRSCALTQDKTSPQSQSVHQSWTKHRVNSTLIVNTTINSMEPRYTHVFIGIPKCEWSTLNNIYIDLDQRSMRERGKSESECNSIYCSCSSLTRLNSHFGRDFFTELLLEFYVAGRCCYAGGGGRLILPVILQQNRVLAVCVLLNI
jgi:hypothetical protein